MTTKEVLLGLAAAGLLAFGTAAPVYAEDPPASDDGSTMEVPADPDSADTGDMAPDPGTDDGSDAAAGDSGSSDDGGEPPSDTPPQ